MMASENLAAWCIILLILLACIVGATSCGTLGNGRIDPGEAHIIGDVLDLGLIAADGKVDRSEILSILAELARRQRDQGATLEELERLREMIESNPQEGIAAATGGEPVQVRFYATLGDRPVVITLLVDDSAVEFLDRLEGGK